MRRGAIKSKTLSIYAVFVIIGLVLTFSTIAVLQSSDTRASYNGGVQNRSQAESLTESQTTTPQTDSQTNNTDVGNPASPEPIAPYNSTDVNLTTPGPMTYQYMINFDPVTGFYDAQTENGTICWASTNCTTVVNDALAVATGMVLFSEGNFPVQNLLIPLSTNQISTNGNGNVNITISGEGDGTVLELSPGANSDLIHTETTGLNGYITIENMCLKGNGANNRKGGIAIHGYGIYQSRFQNLQIENFTGGGIVLQNSTTNCCWDNFISNVYILGCGGTGFNITGGSDTQFYDLEIGSISNGDGLYLNGGDFELTNVHIWGVLGFENAGLSLDAGGVRIYNLFTETNYLGILIGGTSSDIEIYNGEATNNLNTGVVIAGSATDWQFSDFSSTSNHEYGAYIDRYDGQWIGGEISTNANGGFCVNGTYLITISGVHFLRNNGTGLLVTNWSHDVVIDYCTFWDYSPQVQEYGLVLNQAANVNIDNNDFYQNGIAPVSFTNVSQISSADNMGYTDNASP